MDVEFLPVREPSVHEEVRGPIDEPVELPPAEPRADHAVGILEAEERPVGKARRLVGERVTERAGADDVHCRLEAAASRLSGAPMISPLPAAVWSSAKGGSSTATSTNQ